jgi:hypothetical protein
MKLALTIAAMTLNLLCVALFLYTEFAIRTAMGARIACWIFIAVLCLNALAIQFGARFGSRTPDQQQLVSTFD